MFLDDTPHLSHRNIPMRIISISQIGIPNPLFGVRIRANTLAFGAVNNLVESQSEGRCSIRTRTVKAMPICHSIKIIYCIHIRYFCSIQDEG